MNTVGARPRARAAAAGEGDDKAFWISFADLMTALMVLFLVVMAVALLTITRAPLSPPQATQSPATPAPAAPATPASTPAAARPVSPEAEEIERIVKQIASMVDASPGVKFDARRHVIDFGDRARFETGSHRLDSGSENLLRQFVPQLLAIIQSELGQRWVRRVVVEGFADPRGNYLYNLNLSLRRAERVLCALLDSAADGNALGDAQRMQVKRIFAVGGFSFNDQRASLDASRRIEMRVEFGPPPATAPARPAEDTGTCRIG
jgi:outer membrane protein OmpA-like peptidoglycan-associated protein